MKKEEKMKNEKKELKGFGGWLLLLVIVVVLSPFRFIYTLHTVQLAQISDGTLVESITKFSPLFIEGYFNAYMYELIGNVIFFFATLYLIHLMFAKSKLFPKALQVFLVANLLFIIGDHFVINSLAELNQYDDGGLSEKAISSSLISLLIRGSYVGLSVRVKNTFIVENIKKIDIKATVVMALAGLTALLSIGNVNYTGLQIPADFAQTEGAAISGSVIELNKYYEIDYKAAGVNKLENIKWLMEDASVGFKTKESSYILILPEDLDEEAIDFYQGMESKEIADVLESVFAEDIGMDVLSKKTLNAGENEIHVYETSLVVEGDLIQYHIGITVDKDQILNIYTYGSDRDTVTADGENFLQNLSYN